METFRGNAHLPGGDREWNIELEIQWETREVNLHIDEAPSGITDWPGFVRSGTGDLAGIVIGLPDAEGIWRTCPMLLQKVEKA